MSFNIPRCPSVYYYISQIYIFPPSSQRPSTHNHKFLFWCHLCQFHEEYMNINVTFVTANLAEGEILGITLKWACGHFAVRGGSQRMSINVPHHHDPHQTSYSYSLHPVNPENTQYTNTNSKQKNAKPSILPSLFWHQKNLKWSKKNLSEEKPH